MRDNFPIPMKKDMPPSGASPHGKMGKFDVPKGPKEESHEDMRDQIAALPEDAKVDLILEIAGAYMKREELEGMLADVATAEEPPTNEAAPVSPA